MLEHDEITQELMRRFEPVNDDEASPYTLVKFQSIDVAEGVSKFYIRSYGKVFEVTVKEEPRA